MRSNFHFTDKRAAYMANFPWRNPHLINHAKSKKLALSPVAFFNYFSTKDITPYIITRSQSQFFDIMDTSSNNLFKKKCLFFVLKESPCTGFLSILMLWRRTVRKFNHPERKKNVKKFLMSYLTKKESGIF